MPAGNSACQALSTVGVYVPAGDEAGKTGKDISGKGGAFAEATLPVLDTSVGNVCKHAQSGDVDVAFVYTSDVYRFGGVKFIGTVPADTHKNIVPPGAITANCENVEATQEFPRLVPEQRPGRRSGRSGASSSPSRSAWSRACRGTSAIRCGRMGRCAHPPFLV